MELNNIGDFLAGIFGPLTILWLILGFFQQGIELRQNTRVLEMQASELRNSVEQQRELVDVTRKHVAAQLEVIEFERQRQRDAASPKFVFLGVGGKFTNGNGTYTSRIKNLGNVATEVQLVFEPPIVFLSPTTISAWARSEEKVIEWRCPMPSSTVLSISYVDASGSHGRQKFEFIQVKGESHPMVEIKPCGIG